jgi:arabinogalactan oligomer/maltooligosaccharide transport system substrate-binding protein
MNKIKLIPVILALLITGCNGGKKEDDTIKLKIWAPAEEQEILVDMTNAFKEEHPDYKIQFEYAIMGVEASITAIKKDRDVAADIFMYPSGGISELTSAGLILPLNYVAETIRAEHTENAVKSTSLNDVVYGVPVTPNSFFMYYNKSLYTEEEVKSLDVMMHKDLGTIYNFSTNIDDSWYSSSFFFALGCRLFGANGTDTTKADFNSAMGLNAGKYLVDLINNPKYIEDESGLAGTLLKEGKLAAFTSGIWSAKGFKDALGENYGAVKLPTYKVDGASYQLTPFVDYKAYGVNAVTKHAKEAIEVAAYLGSETSQMIRFETNNEAPTIKSLLNHPSVLANIEVKALLDQEALAIPQPATPKLSNFWTPFSSFGSEIVTKTATVDNLQDKLDKMVASILR